MSTLKVDALSSKTSNTDLAITADGSGLVDIETGFKVSGTAGVPTADIRADAITGAKIADDAIDSEHYTDASIDLAHMSVNSIDSDQYVDGSIDTAHLAADAVTGAKIADDAIDSEHYTDGSIDNAHIADDAIDSEHYAAGSIDSAHLADDAVTLAKMAGGTDGNIISYDASGNPVAIATGSDGQVLTSTGAGSPPAFEAAAAGGAYTSIANTAITATQYINFTGFASGTYNNYEVWVSNARPSVDSQILALQTSTDGGSTYDAGTSYTWVRLANSASGGAASGSGPNETHISLTDGVGNDTDENCSLRLSIYFPEEAQRTAFTWESVSDNTSGAIYSVNGVAERKSAADVDAIRFYWSAGDFVAQGTIQFLGIAQ